MIRILIVDDQKLFRESIKAILEEELDLQVVGVALDGYEAIEQVETLKPDIVLMDMEMPKLDGLNAARIICQRFSATKVIILSTHDEDEYVTNAIQVGATGYLIKTMPSEELVKAIRYVGQGYARIMPGLYAQILPTFKKGISSLKAVELAEKISLKLEAHSLPLNSSAIALSEKTNNFALKEQEIEIKHPEPAKEIGWDRVVALLIGAVSLTAGIYFLRHFLAQPLPSLSISQQAATIGDTEFPGKIQPAIAFKIAATTPSVVEEIHVKIGDRVQAGQTLLSLKNLEAEKINEQKLQQQQQQHQLVLQQKQLALQQEQSAKHRIFDLQQQIARLNSNQTPLATQIAEAELQVSVAQTQADIIPLPQRQDSVERTKAIYQLALSRVDRFSKLYSEGAITKDRLEQVQSDLQVAQSDFEVAKVAAKVAQELENAKQKKSQLHRQLALGEQQEKLKQLQQQLQTARLEYNQASQRLAMLRTQASQLATWHALQVNTEVRATSEGVIVNLPVTIGDQIYTGNPLIGLAQLSQLKVEVPVDARLINSLHPGQQTVVKIGIGEAAHKFEGKIVTINPLPNEQLNHTVEVQFENPTHALLVGQLASVQFSPVVSQEGSKKLAALD